MTQDYDAIVIGSGMGGLTAALILAKVFGLRVLVLEQHWTAGGQTHSFTRSGGRYEWDVGLHYVGDPSPGNPLGLLLRFLGNDRLEWRPLHDEYDRICFHDLRFNFRKGRDELRQALAEIFPAESGAIDTYLDDLGRCTGWTALNRCSRIIPRPVGWAMRRATRKNEMLTQQSVAEYMQHRFRSQALRNILVSQWGDYGLPPEHAAFEVHALVTNSFMGGGFYPEGGARRIAEVLIDELERHGGACLTSTKVERIHCEGKRVTRLDLLSKHHGAAPRASTLPVNLLLSDAGAFNTYRHLLDPPVYAELEELEWHSSMAMLFFTLDCDPRTLGFEAANYWLHDSSAETSFAESFQRGAFLAFPSLKRGSRGAHCGELLTLTPFADFRDWEHTRWKQRGDDYESRKEGIAADLVRLAGQFFPELPEHICQREVSSPLSLEFFTRHSRGNPYGVPHVPGRHAYPFCRPTTPFRNLFLVGQDVACLGVMGALMGGVLGATRSQGVNALFPLVWKLWRDSRARRVVGPG